ncbi:NADP-dependent phosphogluconate dehydrogenase [Roseivivax isoporae]|uniref:6-phosphogluconate dehydrogenase, decarboxylating n=1 Tax=Roseivivax isoporae LMG 25204 TaxID=1449351 RepID=X7F2M1_9RHOB|nr:NADP-dependent phosphogluconate dehydrogenase [Roseivivax isoporae]ETX27157.1 6-phosphogluconate dehydrogenase [Roseivivax isoporae LMG 25204]
MAEPRIGIYGLGTMGAALALNMAENGIDIAVANRTASAVPAFLDRAGALGARVTPCDDLAGLIAALPKPRSILAMIPSTAPMDTFLEEVLPLLDEGDTVIDAGNADFHDTRARAAATAEHGVHFVGLGVSGGEDGARHGPSMMFGGPEDSWKALGPVLEAIAAQFEDAPCVARLGPDGAGHFVKTVHNGIEYADMQMIAETCELLRFGAGLAPEAIGDIFARWNEGPLASYLFEITAEILRTGDPATGKPVVDVIVDSAGQKGTGRWTVIEAVRLGQSATMIEAAVAARAWSAERDVRQEGGEVLGTTRGILTLDPDAVADALMAARVLEYAQGFRILGTASDEFGWDLDAARIAEIWRAGCIIRARILDDISAAFHGGATQLHLAPAFADVLARGLPALRRLVTDAIGAGFAVPALASALGWVDTMRQPRGTAALIQAQRDRFGRHGFVRTDAPGTAHGPWWD